MPSFSFDIAGSQIDGARDYQEDAFLITHLGDTASSLVIVADGMGGHAAGNVASNMAVQTFNRHLSKHYPSDDLANVLHEGMLQANESIRTTVAETAALKGMGCTLVACVLERDRLRWVSVGDSHLYLLRDGALTKYNADHSYGGFLDRMMAAGTPVEAESGFSRNMLMSALTGDDIAEIDCPGEALELAAGDRVIVASDGLDTLPSESIVALSASATTARQCVDALLQGVSDAKAPRQDNTTVVVVDVVDKNGGTAVVPPAPLAVDEPAPPPPPPALASRPPRDFTVEATPTRALPRVIAAVAVLAALAAGGYWYLRSQDEVELPPPQIIATEPAPDAAMDDAEAGTADDAATDTATETTTAAATSAAAAQGEFRDALRSGGQGPRMVWVPAGRFTMGGHLPSDNPDQFPQHQVNVAQFAVSRYEISVAEYKRFARATGRALPRLPPIDASEEARFPMTFASWDDALAYTKWLSRQSGHEYTLPSEAQWEYAARGGRDDPYPWGRHLDRGNAHCFACDTGLDPRRPTASGRFQPNGFGLYDVAGNVQEWVYDCYHPSYEGAPTDGSVFEGGDCKLRVLRGGGYGSGPDQLRTHARDKFRPDKGNDQTGIRVVRLR